jgi:hypothetical protein
MPQLTQADEVEQLFRTKGAACMTEMLVWKQSYRPFLLGGNLRAPMSATLPVMGPFDLGGGYQGFLALHPENNSTYVVESITGGIVGSSLEAVRNDIATAKTEVMEKQIEDAKKQVAEAYTVSAVDFWRSLK